MSTFKVTVERLTVLPHPNADALELAQVGMYRAVVARGVYRTGDYALYIPEQAVLPPDLIEELGLTGRLAGPGKNRVKAIRLRGELSQGIVCRPAAMTWRWEDHGHLVSVAGDLDYAEHVGVTKWVPPIPVGMSGAVESAPDLIRWPDIENIKRHPDIFEPGEYVSATEKIHGTCCLVTYTRSSDQVFVTSKGFGGKNLSIMADDKNLYWRAVWQFGVADAAREIAEALDVPRVGIFGEVYGKGVQDLAYGADAGGNDTLGYALFDVAYETADGGVEWAFAGSLVTIFGDEVAALSAVPWVPVVYTGPYDYDTLADLAEGRERVSGRSLHMREGLVVRAVPNRRSDVVGGRAIAKFVSDSYLTRSGGTEFE